MQQPREGGGTHQTLLKEATNQQNATCYIFFALGLSLIEDATYGPSLLLI